jgi:hypothetical protein
MECLWSEHLRGSSIWLPAHRLRPRQLQRRVASVRRRSLRAPGTQVPGSEYWRQEQWRIRRDRARFVGCTSTPAFNLLAQ